MRRSVRRRLRRVRDTLSPVVARSAAFGALVLLMLPDLSQGLTQVPGREAFSLALVLALVILLLQMDAPGSQKNPSPPFGP